MKHLKIVDGRMRTRDFAETIGIDHREVLENVFKILDEMEVRIGEFYNTHLHVKKKEQLDISLDRDLSLVLAAQYSVKIVQHVVKEFNEPSTIDQIDDATENVVDDHLRDAIEDSFDFSCDTRSFVSTVRVVERLVEKRGKTIHASFNNHRLLSTVMGDLGIKKTMKLGKGRGYQLPPMK